MPSRETTMQSCVARAATGHVNLMVDTYLANCQPDDLRAVVRTLLATHSPMLAASFTTAARSRFIQTNAGSVSPSATLFRKMSTGLSVPTSELEDHLARSRSLFGAGMGFTSLAMLTSVVEAVKGHRWEDDGEMADALAMVDADITQAIQSSKEELEAGRVIDLSSARETAYTLKSALKGSIRDTENWGGEFPFERAAASVDYWKF
ncbi:hypothetical protein JAAARDRAFT_42876 [Jaapia argillacea MUCL 33604]|uniref:Uncharacterized protein n=1 Tax=Jaapia argillacea MUCL 33604 TaxID=933084 RepID=A0A067P3J3_9AGAM|nr:hypothetical protein JAAARDRAFT_42876 [Jaapia argillacea MUCL 33604]